jgi:hypothetical protein
MWVEKVDYRVDWNKFRRGTSLFFPCVNCVAAREQLLAVLKRLKIEVVSKVRVEEGIQGIRIWKT